MPNLPDRNFFTTNKIYCIINLQENKGEGNFESFKYAKTYDA